ncbi:MAG: DEAD/DEAH box helicase, partial [Duncaniella sp.]|nr:DEAD/DEAH box helicase [Duncaniella sp.]
MNRLRSTDIKFLRGIGPRRAELLKKHLGIETYYDLLHYFPTSYVDRTKIHSIRSFTDDMPLVQVRGRFFALNVQGEGAKSRLVGLFTDGSGQMEVVWFNRINNIRDSIIMGKEYTLFGKPTVFNSRWSMVHPEIETEATIQADGSRDGFRGVYPIPEQLRNRGFTARLFSISVREMLSRMPRLEETLPDWVIRRMNLLDIRTAIGAVHNPRDLTILDKARFRLKFEELFYLQLDILRYSRRRKDSTPGFHFSRIGYYFNTFYKQFLPFPLTGAQKRVVKEVRADVGSGKQMNRLIQGDVGSGKTIVALLCMLMGLDNGTQACLMAPTEILATQHYETLRRLVAPMGVNIRLLTGSTPVKPRREIHEGLLDGSLHILVGTHAVIEDKVEFKNLGIVVIDEQHRFGVAQRACLWRKNIIAPHVLVMTATPIPRTLAMTVYGQSLIHI